MNVSSTWGGQIKGMAGARLGKSGKEFPLGVDQLELIVDGSREDRIPIMGPSGAGKSTLLNILSGMTFPMGNTARVSWTFPDGFTCEWGDSGPSPDVLLKLRRDYFGYAFQAANLQPQLTVGENLTFALLNKGVSSAEANAQAQAAMRAVFSGDIDRFTNRFESEISGGERQRISLLQALIGDPYVLFADEPTGSLDPETRGDVMAILQNWVTDGAGKRMLIWVTHHGDDPQATDATRRVIVRNGRASLEAVA